MPISNARHRANEKYNAKAYDEIKVRVSKGRKAELQAAAERHGQSVNGLINRLIDEWMERERARTIPADSSPAVSPERIQAGDDTGTQGAEVMVFSDPPATADSSSQFISQSAPVSITGQPDEEPSPKQESLADVVKRLAAMPKEELERQLGVDPEGVERKRQRLAELNASGSRLSPSEEEERRRLMEIFHPERGT